MIYGYLYIEDERICREIEVGMRLIAVDMDGTLVGPDGRVSERNLAAVDFKLTESQVATLDKASDRPPVYPYWHQRQFGERNPPPVPFDK